MDQSLVWLRQFLPAIEAIDFKDANRADDFRVRNVGHEVFASTHGSSSCEQIVDEQGLRARREGILLDLNSVCAVLEGVALLPALSWQLSLLADGDEGQVPVKRQNRSQYETFGL